MSDQILIVINDAPYGQERSFHALRLADALLKIEEELDLTVYLTNDAVLCAKQGQQTPRGYYNIERMLAPILRRGAVLACRTCLEARGLPAEDLVEGVRVAPLGELAQLTLEADKVLVF
jgi:uncharacterized protein involved in oxidation of intracellular sulfur